MKPPAHKPPRDNPHAKGRVCGWSDCIEPIARETPGFCCREHAQKFFAEKAKQGALK